MWFVTVVKCKLDRKFVKLDSGNELWTVIAEQKNESIANKTPLVMVHGFAGGVGLWVS